MSSPSHTLGSWEIEQFGLNYPKFITKDGRRIAQLLRNTGFSEDEIMAHESLILHSPQLLESLQEMVEWFGGMVDGGVTDEARAIVEQAKSVIDKALNK